MKKMINKIGITTLAVIPLLIPLFHKMAVHNGDIYGTITPEQHTAEVVLFIIVVAFIAAFYGVVELWKKSN